MIIAHAADLHITERPVEGGATLKEQVATLIGIGRDAEENGAELMLVAGDVFDRTSTPAERNAAIEVFRDWAQRWPVVLCDGNHDRPGDTLYLSQLRTNNRIYVVGRPEVLEISGALIACLPWPRKNRLVTALGTNSTTDTHNAGVAALRSILQGFKFEFAGWDKRAKILLAHCELGAANMDNGQPVAPHCDLDVSENDLLETGADYIALGHIHLHQIIKERICYAGSPRPTRHGEGGNKGYCLVNVGSDLQIEHRKANYRELITLEAEWKDENLHLEFGDIQDASVRLRYDVDETNRALAAEQAERHKEALINEGAHSVKLDPRVKTVHRIRSEAINAARTNTDRLEAYWKTRELRPDRSVEIRTKLGELEEVAA